MTIYGYNGSSQLLEQLLMALDAEETAATLVLHKADLRAMNCPGDKDTGQVLDFEQVGRVWRVASVQKVVEDRELVRCEVRVEVVENPFPDELTPNNNNQALALTTSAEYTAMEESPLGLARAGVYGIRYDGGYAQIMRVYWARVVDKALTEEDRLNNPRQRKIGKTVLMVDYRYEQPVTAARLLDQHNSCSLAEYQKTYTHIEGTLEAHLSASKHLAEGGDLPAELAEAIFQSETEKGQASAQLVRSSNPDFLRGVVLRAERNANTATVLRASMERNLTEMRNRMATRMAGLHTAMEHFTRQIQKVQRLIVTLELYLGVHENLIQIAEGQPAALDEPITLRQLVLFADEEFGDPANGGLTFERLPDFDAWLVESGAYRLLTPEARCIVAIKPRRKARVVEGDVMPMMQDAAGKYLDSYTYILIRNGDNLYRIQTPNVEVGNTLFPLRADLQKLLERMDQIQQMEEEVLAEERSQSSLDRFRSEVEADLHGYQKSILLLQGLLFRTTVLHPLPVGLNLMKPETYGGMVEFIYDGEALLPSGRLSFKAWQADINSRIQRGSRVLVAMNRTRKGSRIDPADYKGRYTLANLVHADNTPPLPKMGVYSVDSYEQPVFTAVYDEIPWADLTESRRQEWQRHNQEYDSDVRDWVVKVAQPEKLKLRRYDKQNYPVSEKTGSVTHLLIRYNPKDKVTVGGWGAEFSEHQRKNSVGFRINPKYDDWLFNYDELTLDDINFYLTDRIERANYVEMMPFLYELRQQLEKELAWEQQFTQLLSEQLQEGLASKLPAAIDLVALTQEAIRWYKLEKVKIKRSLTDRDAQALLMVEQRVRHYLRERHKLRDIDAGVDFRKKTLIWHHKQSGRSFVATGFLKADFVDECLYVAISALPAEYAGANGSKAGRVTRTRVEREMQHTTLAAAVALAASHPGEVIELPG